MSGLNVEQFVTDAAKSLLGKLGGNFITQFTNSSLGESLAALGNTYQTIQALGTVSADNILNGAVNSYFNSSGLNRVFGAINLNPQEYASKIRPDTKINNVGNEGALIYPKDLGPYYMSFHFKKYTRPAPFVDASTEIIQSVYLPLPQQLIEMHSIGWNEFQGGMFGAAADIAQYIAAGGQMDASTGTKAAALLGAATAGRIVHGVAGLVGADALPKTVEQSLGGSINPNLSVSFDGPRLRDNLNFTWEFNPHNADESIDLKKILTDMKKFSLPALAIDGSAQFLAYPHIVEIRIHAGEQDDLILFKQAVVTNMVLNYAPQGIPSFFKHTREPTFIGVSLTLREIEYFLSEDFGGKSGEKGEAIADTINEGVNRLTNSIPGLSSGIDFAKGLLPDFGG